MKILIIRTFPDILNLTQYNVQEVGLAKALTLRGHRCDIVLYHGKQPDQTEQYSFCHEDSEYQFTIYWLKGYALFKNGFMPTAKKLIPKYDVIQVHEYDQILSWQIYTSGRKPVVLYHGPYYHEYTKGYNLKCRIFDQLFLKWREHDQVAALAKSELAAGFLLEKGFPKARAVGVGMDPANFDRYPINLTPKNEEEQAGIHNQCKGNPCTLLYIGKIEERRNVYFMITVFRKLLNTYPDIQLQIIGDGETGYKEDFLKSIEQELQTGKIRYQQKISQQEIAGAYQAADIFLFTSNYEIFGMVLLEAMYAGLTVVSSLNGGSSTLIQNERNGYILSEFEEEQWIKCLQQLIAYPQKRISMGQEAHKTIEQGYLWERLAEKFEQAYQKAWQDFYQ